MKAIVDAPGLAGPNPHPSVLSRARALPSTACERRPVHLDHRDTLRIVDGAGVRLRACSGVVWITEETSSRDTVLLPGDSYEIGNEGLTLALAHRPARLLVERRAGVRPPRRADVVTPCGERVGGVVLRSRRLALHSRIAAIGRTMRRRLALVSSDTRDIADA